jgi:alpha-glucosidase
MCASSSCRTGDPLYKHWPLLIVKDGETGAAYGIFYDNLAPATFDLGCEHSNYYGRFRMYEAPDGDLDYYFILGPRIRCSGLLHQCSAASKPAG